MRGQYMISNRELEYLNHTLDGKEIYGINLLGSISKEPIMKSPNYYKSRDFNRYYDELLENLKLYKNAIKYVWVKDLIAAVVDDETVVILKKFKAGDVLLSRAGKKQFITGLLNIYEYLKYDDDSESIKENCSLKNILDNKLNESKKWFYIKEVINHETVSFNIYYLEKDKLYKYNLYTKVLKNINSKDLRNDFLRMFKQIKI